MTIYIQRSSEGQLETVDECESAIDARFLVNEYNMSDPTAHHYASQRACKDWNNR